MEFNKAVGLRIKEARINSRLSLKDLGTRVGLSEGTMQRYETGQIKGVDVNLLKKIADVLECSEAYIMGWEEVKSSNQSSKGQNVLNNFYSEKEKGLISKYRKADDNVKSAVDTILDMADELERSNNDKKDCILEEPQTEYNDDTKIIPFCPQLVSAGTGQYVFDDFPTETIAVDNKKFRRATYAIRVRGNSMEPTFYNDDIIIVDRDAVPSLNEIGIFIIDNQGYVKRVGDKALISDNKAYAPIEADDIVCMGKVLGKI